MGVVRSGVGICGLDWGVAGCDTYLGVMGDVGGLGAVVGVFVFVTVDTYLGVMGVDVVGGVG